MKRFLIAALGCAALALPLHAQSAADMASDLGSVRFTAIRSLEIKEIDGKDVAYFLADLLNKNHSELVLSNAVFDQVLFSRADGQGKPVTLGPALNPIEKTLTPGSLTGPSTTSMLVAMVIGPVGAPETTERLIDLINLVGAPSNALNVTLQGNVEIGVKSGQTTGFAPHKLRLALTTESHDRLLIGK